MNKIYNYNSINPKRLRPCYEHGQKKMSHGDYAKCPTTSNSLSLNLDIGTVRVPESDRRKMESFLQQKVNHAMQDMKWYSVDIGKTIMNPVGFFKNALKRDLLRTTA